MIFLDISPSEASFASNVVTFTGASGSKYLFEVRDANGDMVTLISKIASDSVANSPRIFYSSNTILPWSGIAGATINNDATAFTISVPANALAANSSWRVLWQCLGGASTGSKTFKLYDQTLGATNGLIVSSQNSVASQLINKEVIMTCHTAATQTISQTNITGSEVTKAIDFSVARTLIGSINISNTSESASAFKSVLIVQTN